MWQLAIHQGNKWVARKVKDNEVVYIPNNFMMNKVDVTDKDGVMVSPGLVEKAIKDGKYKPAVEGQWTDFNFREAYQPAKLREAQYNFSRNQIAWKKITGKTFNSADEFPYSVVPNKKFGVEDVKKNSSCRLQRRRKSRSGTTKRLRHFQTDNSRIRRICDGLQPAFHPSIQNVGQTKRETPYVPLLSSSKTGSGDSLLDLG